MLDGEVNEGDTVTVSARTGKVTFKAGGKAAAA